MLLAIIADRLSNGENVRFSERPVQRGPTMSAGSKRNQMVGSWGSGLRPKYSLFNFSRSTSISLGGGVKFSNRPPACRAVSFPDNVTCVHLPISCLNRKTAILRVVGSNKLVFINAVSWLNHSHGGRVSKHLPATTQSPMPRLRLPLT